MPGSLVGPYKGKGNGHHWSLRDRYVPTGKLPLWNETIIMIGDLRARRRIRTENDAKHAPADGITPTARLHASGNAGHADRVRPSDHWPERGRLDRLTNLGHATPANRQRGRTGFRRSPAANSYRW